MKTPAVCLFAAMACLKTVFAASAAKTPDLRDPAIWREESAPVDTRTELPCEVRSGPHCPRWEDEKSAIQIERERRERRLQDSYFDKRRRD